MGQLAETKSPIKIYNTKDRLIKRCKNNYPRKYFSFKY